MTTVLVLYIFSTMTKEVVDVDVPADTFKTIVDGHFCGDLEHVVRLYYGRLTRMLELGGFDIVGHADKMHYNAACYRPDCWTSLGMMSWLGVFRRYSLASRLSGRGQYQSLS